MENEETMTPVLFGYSFLLTHNRVYSGKEFAEKIKEAYSIDEPRNKAVYDFLMESTSTYSRRR